MNLEDALRFLHVPSFEEIILGNKAEYITVNNTVNSNLFDGFASDKGPQQ